MSEPTDRRTTLTRAGVRVLAGAAGLAATVVVVIAAFTLPVPGAQAHAQSTRVTPVPATASVACPGPLLQLGSDASTSSLSALGRPTVVSGGDSASPAAVPFTASNVSAGPNEPKAFELKATDPSRAPLLAAAQSSMVRSAEVRGLTAANCVQPDFEQWLVGGATALGATTLVVLGNPGDVAASVDIDTYTEQGIAAGAGGTGIVVKPHTQLVVPLAGLAPNASATIVHVTSTGGTVSAQLLESEISGVTPQGAEWVGPTAAPARKTVIPGVVLDGSALSATATDSDDGGVPVLRVLPVGSSDAKLTIGAKSEGGTGSGTALNATASHGVVSEIPLDKLGKGTYDVTVDSTQPVVVAVHTSTVSAKQGTDFAWYAAAASLTGAAAIPVAPGPAATVHLVNTTTKTVKVKLDGAGGGTFALAAGAAAGHRVTRGGVLTIADAQGVAASVSYADAGGIAAYVAYPPSAAAAALTVYRR